MEDSNQLHAICLDTYPPCVYMNKVSHTIVQLVHQYNQPFKSTKVYFLELLVNIEKGKNICVLFRLVTLLMPDQMPVFSYLRRMSTNLQVLFNISSRVPNPISSVVKKSRLQKSRT